ncbi:hypothetical protein GS399_09275 [Pedobacter sp. HMF7647]|uniref:Sensor of ECF-type sigma factor n=1 Tax=Hufsiella arboris TaxID=2695275 RepID=A0A7K1YAM7_9SPHI|nr:hypothetical protein [Hufsiella arboris]MXV51159.1 hypothetical protein [Hufsiella arboris]
MKPIIFLFLFSIAAFGASAQSSGKEDLAIVQSVFQKDKKQLVSQYMTLDSAQSQSFWKVYDEYEAKRKDLSTERVGIISDYAKQYATLTDEQAGSLAKRMLSNDKSNLSLQTSYFKKFSKAVGAKNAAKFYQLDNYLQTVIRANVQDQIPFIGELNKTRKPGN